jgi:hypothetical protein
MLPSGMRGRVPSTRIASDPVLDSMLGDERHHHLGRRSSSACGKEVATFPEDHPTLVTRFGTPPAAPRDSGPALAEFTGRIGAVRGSGTVPGSAKRPASDGAREERSEMNGARPSPDVAPDG